MWNGTSGYQQHQILTDMMEVSLLARLNPMPSQEFVLEAVKKLMARKNDENMEQWLEEEDAQEKPFV